MNSLISRKRGFGLVEVVIGSAVLSVSLLAISGFFQTVLRASRVTESAVQGDYLLEEGMEVVKIFRDRSYTSNIKNMSTTTPYYFSWNVTNWATTTTKTIIDSKYERKLTFADVKRDSITKDISDTGVYDPDIKLATVSVTWWAPVVGTTTRSIQTYIVNLFNS
ncbi:MAG: prepilin-type N-terminal cleavage/methylation domain-containing protein [Minisyncoccia bacterium]